MRGMLDSLFLKIFIWRGGRLSGTPFIGVALCEKVIAPFIGVALWRNGLTPFMRNAFRKQIIASLIGVALWRNGLISVIRIAHWMRVYDSGYPQHAFEGLFILAIRKALRVTGLISDALARVLHFYFSQGVFIARRIFARVIIAGAGDGKSFSMA